MEIRRIKDSDFNTIGQWWIDHGGKMPDKEFLPHEGTGGFIVSSNEKDIAAGYLYFTNASIACLLYTSPSPRDATLSRMPSSA